LRNWAPQRTDAKCATALIAAVIATVLVSGIAFVPTPTEAAKLSNAERVALEKATAACKEEAKGMKFRWHWRKRQKYVQNCIIRSASQQGIDIEEIRKAVNMKDLPSHVWTAPALQEKNLTFPRSVRVQPCIRPLNAAAMAAGPDVEDEVASVRS
jgi:hypothetical protein